MTTRFAATLLTLALLTMGFSSRLLAHEGHDHKVMGTVTMVAPDHVMLKDQDGKDVTIQITKETKMRSKPSMKIGDLKVGSRVVVTATMAEDKTMRAKIIEVGAAPAAAK